MYSTILWATDGSADADAALREALALLEPCGRIVAFHCDQRFRGTRLNGAPLFADEPDRRRHIHAQIMELRDQGIDVEEIVETTTHDPAPTVTNAARELDVDVIVCGTRGLNGIEALLDGSVAAALLRTASVPVLVVPAAVTACHPDAAAV